MELERQIFARVISSHSIKMQRVVDVFKRNREEHKEAFRSTPKLNPKLNPTHYTLSPKLNPN